MDFRSFLALLAIRYRNCDMVTSDQEFGVTMPAYGAA
jgi:hypothetical protein